MKFIIATISWLASLATAGASGALATRAGSYNVSHTLFDSLEELARIVDITYCVGSTGIQSPFHCLSRCRDFQGFELVTTWHTGPLLSDSCGYIALSHPPLAKRIIVAFRGTYSIANTIVDLATIPAEYVPFVPDAPGGDDRCASESGYEDMYKRQAYSGKGLVDEFKCENCTVHAGFLTSWINTRCTIIPAIEKAIAAYPDYQLTLVGHSLGGAVASLASLEFQMKGWSPQVTTFGEPRVGNRPFTLFLDKQFKLTNHDARNNMYRRVTHISDPVPLLPVEEMGFCSHAGEIFISKYDLPPVPADLRHCDGDQDPQCIGEAVVSGTGAKATLRTQTTWHLPQNTKLWELFFAHRDYFWRLGLCLPPTDDLWPPIELQSGDSEL